MNWFKNLFVSQTTSSTMEEITGPFVGPPQVEALFDQMQQNCPALNGWDMVLNVTEASVNAGLQADYYRNRASTWESIAVTNCITIPNPQGGTLAEFTRLVLDLSQPRLNLLADDGAFVSVAFEASGTKQTAFRLVAPGFDPRAADANDSTLRWQSDPLGTAPFEARVPLSIVTVESQGSSIIFDFPKGSFNSPILPSEDNGWVQEELRVYFAAHDVRYQLTALNGFSAFALLTPWSPNQIRLNAHATNTGNAILQVFAMTQGQAPAELTILLDEPIPDGVDATLMFSRALGLAWPGELTPPNQPITMQEGGMLWEIYRPCDVLYLPHPD